MIRPWMVPLFGLALLVGCGVPETVQRRSSLSAYLGAKTAAVEATATTPVRLQLPLRLGIAFVPAGPSKQQGHMSVGQALGPFSAGGEPELHEQVARLFGQKPWTLSFKTIPAQYLSPGGGFEDLEGVARSFGVDVIALVSVDQLQFSSPRWYAWTYWTLVGAYMIQADANDTTTLVDAAVYHVPTRTFLFRAGGQGTAKGSSSWSGREEMLRAQSRESLRAAMASLSTSLDQGVAAFKRDLLSGARRDVVLLDPAGHPYGSTDYDPARRPGPAQETERR